MTQFLERSDMAGLARKFDSLPFTQKLIVSSLVFDPIGAVGGYLLAPEFGLDPIMGAVYGLVLASVPTAVLVAREQR